MTKAQQHTFEYLLAIVSQYKTSLHVIISVKNLHNVAFRAKIDVVCYFMLASRLWCSLFRDLYH